MEKVCLIGGLRSYIGLTGGVYRHVPAELLGAAVLKAVTEKYNVVPQQIICGNGVGAGGKTASAQTGIYLEPGVEESEVVHAWFAGYFPADTPKYAVVLLVEDGKSGEDTAAPIFRKIADGILVTELQRQG